MLQFSNLHKSHIIQNSKFTFSCSYINVLATYNFGEMLIIVHSDTNEENSSPQSKNAVCDISAIFFFLFHEKILQSMFYQMAKTIFEKYF